LQHHRTATSAGLENIYEDDDGYDDMYHTTTTRTRERSERDFLQSTNQEKNLKILYEARGKEILRLKEQVKSMEEQHGEEQRQLRHQVALLKADNQRYNIGHSHMG